MPGLTAVQCKTLGDGKHSDGDGLRLVVRGQTRAWTLAFTSPKNGKRREIGLGKLDEVSLEKARKAASAKRDQVRQGIDPIEVAIEQRAAGMKADAERRAAKHSELSTLRRVVRTYHETKVEPVLTGKHGKQWLASIENHLPPKLLDAPIAKIEASELLDALQPIYLTVPETGRRIRQRLDAVFDHAVLRKLVSTNPAKVIVRELRAKRDRSHFRAMHYSDVPVFVARLHAQPSAAARALEFAMLTGARTAEVLGMRWSELSADGKTWTVPASRMKAGVAHIVNLSKQARAILAELRGHSAEWVFRSPMKDAPLSNMAMLTLLRRLGVDKVTTVHGLCRSSLSTWAYETAAARPDVIEAALAHREGDRVKAAYNRAKFAEERRLLLQTWGDFVAPSRKQKAGSNVAVLSSRARR